MGTCKPLFPLGVVVATPRALEALDAAGAGAWELLWLHRCGHWGDIDAHDRAENEAALRYGGRLLSAYILPTGVKVWVITEADRSATTLLLPEEY